MPAASLRDLTWYNLGETSEKVKAVKWVPTSRNKYLQND